MPLIEFYKKLFCYLPMQKSLKIEPSISSTSTFPIMAPKCLVAILKSSAANSISLDCFFSRNFSNSNKHKFNLFLCLSRDTKIFLVSIIFLLNLSLIKFINLSIFLLFLTEIKIPLFLYSPELSLLDDEQPDRT